MTTIADIELRMAVRAIKKLPRDHNHVVYAHTHGADTRLIGMLLENTTDDIIGVDCDQLAFGDAVRVLRNKRDVDICAKTATVTMSGKKRGNKYRMLVHTPTGARFARGKQAKDDWDKLCDAAIRY